MINQHFSYVCPADTREALQYLAEPGLRSQVLAGGTDLTIELRSGAIQVDRVVDVTRIPALKAIFCTDQGLLSVGAAATFNDVIYNPLLQKQAPLLVQACREVGSEQIRNLGTLGGNVANASLSADSLPALVCLEAVAVIQSPQGETRLPVSELIRGPRRVQIPAGGLIQCFEFQAQPAGSRFAFGRVGRRKAMSIARLSMAALGNLDGGGLVQEIRLVPGCAFATFRRSSEVEALILGQKPTEDLFVTAGQRMAELYMSASGKRWSAEWKEKAIRAITERALRQVFGGTHEA